MVFAAVPAIQPDGFAIDDQAAVQVNHGAADQGLGFGQGPIIEGFRQKQQRRIAVIIMQVPLQVLLSVV